MAYKKLFRSSDDRKIFGVCGGLGEFLDIDPLIFRIIFLFLLICAGSGLLLYLIMWFLMPEKKNSETIETPYEEVNDPENIEENYNNDSLNNNGMKKNKGIFWGLLLVAVGLLWLGKTFGLFYFSWCNVVKLWPMLIIWFGITLLPIEQVWKNVCNFILLVVTVVLLFVLPVHSCHHFFWKDKDKYKYEIKKKFKNKEHCVDDDIDLIDDDETITVSVDSNVITINAESKENGEKKVIVKKIKY